MRLIDEYSRITVEHFKDAPSVIAYNIWDEPNMEGFSLGGLRGGDSDPHFEHWFEQWWLENMAAPPPGSPSGTTPSGQHGVRGNGVRLKLGGNFRNRRRSSPE